MKTQSIQRKNSIQQEKFNMLNPDQKFVNELLDKHGIEIKWLADRLNMDYETVRYQLRDSKNYRQEFHVRVKEVLKKEGLISSSSECTEKLKDELIDFSTVLSGTISIVSRGVKERLPNGLTTDEKKEIKSLIRTQLSRITDEFNDMIITIDLLQ